MTYDELGGTVQAENVGSNGGYIEVSWVGNQEVYRISLAPFTGKLTVQKCPCT